jgi:Ca-activated chloride channel family protein
MVFDQFHFLQPAWLWALLAIPLAMLAYALFFRAAAPLHVLERFADRHLLPHLLKRQSAPAGRVRRSFLVWSATWVCGVAAMAGPSWDYTDRQTFKTPENLVIILDLSRGMNARDVKPSRVARARQEIQDLLDLNRGADIGLVAYAAVPHMVTPLTDDVRTIENLLPDLDTSLVTVQGDRLQPALEMAARMLKAEPSKSNSILVISDGAFEESDFAGLARAAGNAAIYTMGIGAAITTFPSQAPQLAGETGNWVDSGLQASRLQQLAAAGHGIYVEANYSDSDTRAILRRINAAKGSAQATPASVRLWEDRFYIPLLAMLLLLLPLFRRRIAVAGILALTLVSAGGVRAATPADLFLNRNQQADAAFNKRDYKNALAKFDTDYRRGVVAYKAGKYKQAAALFKSAARRGNDLDALYNLGNAQLMQLQPQDAISSYEAVLKQRPGDVPAQHNLALARKMLEEQIPRTRTSNKARAGSRTIKASATMRRTNPRLPTRTGSTENHSSRRRPPGRPGQGRQTRVRACRRVSGRVLRQMPVPHRPAAPPTRASSATPTPMPG